MEIIPTQKIINRDGIKAVKNGQKANKHSSVPNQKKPEWIRVKATFDKNFKDKRTGEMGFSFDRFDWPHGNTDSGVPHGSVFSIK